MTTNELFNLKTQLVNRHGARTTLCNIDDAAFSETGDWAVLTEGLHGKDPRVLFNEWNAWGLDVQDVLEML